ncbi:MAG: c-type cytochrome [Acidobacteria bacterium]|nr:c-type cytochrome [Acidobacteriota bacterium]
MSRRTVGLLLVIAVVVVSCGGTSRTPLLADGRILYTSNGCAACHGSAGEGGAGGPLADVVRTFPQCSEHVEWVELGSAGWVETKGDTYGSAGKPITGEMPSFSPRMTEKEIRTVAAYERVEFGRLEEETVRADCGV